MAAAAPRLRRCVPRRHYRYQSRSLPRRSPGPLLAAALVRAALLATALVRAALVRAALVPCASLLETPSVLQWGAVAAQGVHLAVVDARWVVVDARSAVADLVAARAELALEETTMRGVAEEGYLFRASLGRVIAPPDRRVSRRAHQPILGDRNSAAPALGAAAAPPAAR